MGALDDTATAINTLIAALNQIQAQFIATQTSITTAHNELLHELGTTTTHAQIRHTTQATINATQHLAEATNHLQSAVDAAAIFAAELGLHNQEPTNPNPPTAHQIQTTQTSPPPTSKTTPANTHTNYVVAGTTPVLVHNCGGDIPWSSPKVGQAAKDLENGATSVNVASRSQAEELFLRQYQCAGYRNASGFDGPGTRQYFGSKSGTYHWDDELGADGRVVGHGPGNADGDLPHLQIHTFDGPIVRIFWGG